jgi:ribose transport system substrate-binding protein
LARSRTVRWGVVLLALIAGIVALAGCGSSGSSSTTSTESNSGGNEEASSTTTASSEGGESECSVSGKKIQLVGPLKSNPTIQIMAAGFTQTAEKLGFESQELLSEGAEPQEMIALGEQALAQGSDGIVLLALEASMYPFIQKASAQGVPVVVTHFPVPQGEKYGLKQDDLTNPAAYAEEVAEAVGKKLGGKGSVAVTQGSFNTTENLVAKTFTETMAAKYPGVTVLKPEVEGFDHPTAVAKAVSILQANPEVNAAFSTTGEGVETWSGASEETGRKLTIVGMDYTPHNLDLIKEGKVYAIVAQPLYEEHQLAVESLKTLICGGTVEYEPTLPAPLVTKANLKEYEEILAKTGV